MSLSCKDIIDLETSKYKIAAIRYLEDTRYMNKIHQIQAYFEFFTSTNNINVTAEKKERALIGCYEKVFTDPDLYFKNLIEYFDLRRSFHYLLRRVTASSNITRFEILEKIMLVIDTEYVVNNRDTFIEFYFGAYFNDNDYMKYQFWKICDACNIIGIYQEPSSDNFLTRNTKKRYSNTHLHIHNEFLSVLLEKNATNIPHEINQYIKFYRTLREKYIRHVIDNDNPIVRRAEILKYNICFSNWCEKISNNPDIKTYNIFIKTNEDNLEITEDEKNLLINYLKKTGFPENEEIDKKYEIIREYAEYIFSDQYEYFVMNFFIIATKSHTNKNIIKFFVNNLVDIKTTEKYVFYYAYNLFFKLIDINEFVDCFKSSLISKISRIFENSYTIYEDIMKIHEITIKVINYVGPLKGAEIMDIKRIIERYTYEKKDYYQTIIIPNINSPLISTTFMVDNSMINIPNTGLRKYLNTFRDEKKKKPHISLEFNFYVSKCVIDINYPSGKIEVSMNFIDAFILIIIDKHRNLDLDQLVEESGINKEVVTSTIVRLGKMIRENGKIFEMNPDYKSDTKSIQFVYKLKTKTIPLTNEITSSMLQSMKCNVMKMIKRNGKIKRDELFRSCDIKEMKDFDSIIDEFIEKEYVNVEDNNITYLA